MWAAASAPSSAPTSPTSTKCAASARRSLRSAAPGLSTASFSPASSPSCWRASTTLAATPCRRSEFRPRPCPHPRLDLDGAAQPPALRAGRTGTPASKAPAHDKNSEDDEGENVGDQCRLLLEIPLAAKRVARGGKAA